MRQTVTVSLPSPLKGGLDRLSRKDHVSRSDLVREAVRRYLSLREFEGLREKWLPLAAKRGLFTDEDVFKALK